MGYYIVKSIKIDKTNNKISGVVADSNWRDYKGRYIYDKVEDFYSQYNTIGDKIATLYCDIISGGFHTSISKYADLVCSFDYFKDYLDKYSIDYNNPSEVFANLEKLNYEKEEFINQIRKETQR